MHGNRMRARTRALMVKWRGDRLPLLVLLFSAPNAGVRQTKSTNEDALSIVVHLLFSLLLLLLLFLLLLPLLSFHRNSPPPPPEPSNVYKIAAKCCLYIYTDEQAHTHTYTVTHREDIYNMHAIRLSP